jgi:hypothetical protein
MDTWQIRMQDEVTVAYVKVPSRNSTGKTEENHEKHWPITWQGIRPNWIPCTAYLATALFDFYILPPEKKWTFTHARDAVAVNF